MTDNKVSKLSAILGLALLLVALAFITLPGIGGPAQAAPAVEARFMPRLQPVSATLHLQKTGTPDQAAVGERITYTLSYSNSGPYTATTVQLVDTLPSGVALVHTDPVSDGLADNRVRWDISQLAPNESGTITLAVIANAAGQVVNRADITAALAQGAAATQTTPVSSTAYLPLIMKPEPPTTLYIIADNTGGISLVRVLDPDTEAELLRCGPLEDSSNPQWCGQFRGNPYKLEANTIKCGTQSGIFDDAEPGQSVTRRVYCN